MRGCCVVVVGDGCHRGHGHRKEGRRGGSTRRVGHLVGNRGCDARKGRDWREGNASIWLHCVGALTRDRYRRLERAVSRVLQFHNRRRACSVVAQHIHILGNALGRRRSVVGRIKVDVDGDRRGRSRAVGICDPVGQGRRGSGKRWERVKGDLSSDRTDGVGPFARNRDGGLEGAVGRVLQRQGRHIEWHRRVAGRVVAGCVDDHVRVMRGRPSVIRRNRCNRGHSDREQGRRRQPTGGVCRLVRHRRCRAREGRNRRKRHAAIRLDRVGALTGNRHRRFEGAVRRILQLHRR